MSRRERAVSRAEPPPFRVRVAHLLGAGLGVAGAAWIVVQLVGSGAAARPAVSGSRLVVLAGGAALGYVALLLLLALAWWWLTGAYGPRRQPLATVAVWTRSQIGKYVPGNVFQYVGRQALGRRLGLSHEAMLAAHLFEMLSLLAAVTLIGLTRALLAVGGEPGATAPLWPAAIAVVAFLLLWPLVDRALRRLPFTARRMLELPTLPLGRLVAVLALPLALHAVFMLGVGAVLFGLVRVGWRLEVEPFEVIWLYALAWTAGTLSPGAPAGLGVREAAIAIGLAPAAGEERAAAVAVALRLVTVVGDLLATGLGALVPLPAPAASTAGSAEHPVLRPEAPRG